MQKDMSGGGLAAASALLTRLPQFSTTSAVRIPNWFDTTPYGENPPGLGGGAWAAWPFFESGMVVVSSMNEGLFILRTQRPVT